MLGTNLSLSHSRLDNLQQFNSADLYKIQLDDGQIKKRFTIIFLDDKLSDVDMRLSVSNDQLLTKASAILATKDMVAINGLLSSAIDDQTLNLIIDNIKSNYNHSEKSADVQSILRTVRERVISFRQSYLQEGLGINQPDSSDLTKVEALLGL